MLQSGDYFREKTHPLTFMLQNYDADKLRTHQLPWQVATTLKLFFRFGGF